MEKKKTVYLVGCLYSKYAFRMDSWDYLHCLVDLSAYELIWIVALY